MIEDNWRWFEIVDADRDWSSWIEINLWWFEMNDIDDKPKINGWKRIVFAFFNLELIKIFLNPVNIKWILEIVHYLWKMLTLTKYI